MLFRSPLRGRTQSPSHDHSFKRRPCTTVTDALRGTALAPYAAAFTRANLDDAELCDLSVLGIPELQSVVPDAPLSDVLRLKAVLSKAFEPVAHHPASPYWFYCGPTLSTMQLAPETANEAFLMWEVSMVVSALILSVSIGILLDARLACADGDPCDALVRADLVIWALVVTSTACSIAALRAPRTAIPRLWMSIASITSLRNDLARMCR